MTAPSSAPRRRPPVRHTDDPRAFPLVLRVTASERDAIRIAADRHAITVSDYLRDRCMGYEIPTPRSPMSARAFRVLSGLTNNLNQTVRQIHEGWVRDTADLAPVIKAIQIELEDLRTRFAEGLSSTHDEPLDLAEEAQAVRRRGGRAPVDQLAQIQAVVEILENASKKGGV